MTLHTIMSNSTSFIDGLKWARKLGDTLTHYVGVEVFPYSVFYVYYEQYLTTVHDMALNIGVSIGTIGSGVGSLLGKG
jgi:Niemann-Pick C1 protein